MDASLIDQVTVNTLFLVWAVYLLSRLRQDQSFTARSVILKFLGSILLELLLSSCTRLLQSTWWTRALEIGSLHSALLLMYVASEQLLNNRPYWPLIKHRLVPLMLLSTVCGTAIGALGGQNLEAFLVDPAFRLTPLSTVSYFWNYGLQLCFVVLTLKLYVQSLGRYAVLTYLTRRLICIVSFSLAACALCVAEVNLFLFLCGEKNWHFSLSQITLVGETLALWLLVAGFTIPQDVMERIIQPLEDSLAWRKWLQHDLLYALHQRMIQIVPCVHLPYDELQDIRILIEVSDARQVIWSHVPLTHPFTAKEEADYLLLLLQQNIVMEAPGTYQPARTRRRNVLKHNLAVARRLRRYERQGCISDLSFLHAKPSGHQPLLESRGRVRVPAPLQEGIFCGILRER